MSYIIMQTPDFVKQLYQLDKDVFAKWQRIGQKIYENPFDSSLQYEKICTAQDGVASEIGQEIRDESNCSVVHSWGQLLHRL